LTEEESCIKQILQFISLLLFMILFALSYG